MTATEYDAVRYPSAVYSQTHPGRLAVLATLYGIDPPPVDRCRVLELGCGDGWNLISMAYGLPESEFTGIDLASTVIERGTAFAQELGLQNLHLRQLDVMEASDLGEFDYIIAHGLYSWVPEPVRIKIMEICGRSLAGNGVAYISYNAYPGNHLRDMVRGMMGYHAGHFSQPEDKVRQARAFLKFLVESKEPPDLYHQLLAQESERLGKYSDSGLFHDDLNSTNQPFYFHEFMTQAAPHGLQFLGEANIADNFAPSYSPKVEAALAELNPADIVGREQYLDFLRCRTFRQTLLCRQEQLRQQEVRPERAMRLRVAGDIRPASPEADLQTPQSVIFHGLNGSEIETSDQVLQAVCLHLGALWPECIPFGELLDHAMRVGGFAGTGKKAEVAASLAAALVKLFATKFLEFRAHRPRLAGQPGPNPQSSAVARFQIRSGNRVTSLRHTVEQMDDPLSRALLLLLDGSRDRAALQAELTRLPVRDGGDPVTGEALEAGLRDLARRALLIG